MLENEKESDQIMDTKEKEKADETTHLFIFGNIKIVDKITGEVLVNKPF